MAGGPPAPKRREKRRAQIASTGLASDEKRLYGNRVGKLLRILALLVAAAAIAFWLARGSNRGWTKTSVPKETPDPVTGIVGVSYEKRFVPGVDFLTAALLASALVAGASFLCRNQPNSDQTKN
jgi:hypothetical protein